MCAKGPGFNARLRRSKDGIDILQSVFNFNQRPFPFSCLNLKMMVAYVMIGRV